jgi:hypothetical protein
VSAKWGDDRNQPGGKSIKHFFGEAVMHLTDLTDIDFLTRFILSGEWGSLKNRGAVYRVLD